MKNKNIHKKVYSYAVYKTLLENYSRPELSLEKADSLMEEYYSRFSNPEETPIFSPSIRYSRILAYVAMVIFIPLILLKIVDYNLPLQSPVIITFQQNTDSLKHILKQESLETQQSPV